MTHNEYNPYGTDIGVLAANLLAAAVDGDEPNLIIREDNSIGRLPMGTNGYSDLDRLVAAAAEQKLKTDDVIKGVATEAALVVMALIQRYENLTQDAAIAMIRYYAQDRSRNAMLNQNPDTNHNNDTTGAPGSGDDDQ